MIRSVASGSAFPECEGAWFPFIISIPFIELYRSYRFPSQCAARRNQSVRITEVLHVPRCSPWSAPAPRRLWPRIRRERRIRVQLILHDLFVERRNVLVGLVVIILFFIVVDVFIVIVGKR